MNRAMLLITNDPSMPEIRLEISGDVTPRKYISTDTVRLTGTAGTKIIGGITISPTPENPFKLTDIKAEKGENIRFDVVKQQNPEGIEYQLTVSNTKPEKGWYLDKIHIHTDSEKSPEFIITVFGVIRED